MAGPRAGGRRGLLQPGRRRGPAKPAAQRGGQPIRPRRPGGGLRRGPRFSHMAAVRPRPRGWRQQQGVRPSAAGRRAGRGLAARSPGGRQPPLRPRSSPCLPASSPPAERRGQSRWSRGGPAGEPHGAGGREAGRRGRVWGQLRAHRRRETLRAPAPGSPPSCSSRGKPAARCGGRFPRRVRRVPAAGAVSRREERGCRAGTGAQPRGAQPRSRAAAKQRLMGEARAAPVSDWSLHAAAPDCAARTLSC